MKLIPHVLKAVIIVLLVPVMAAAATHTVNQVGLTFSPAAITIEVGDTVEWIWSTGSHTVTSGTDLNDPEVGALFDTPLNSGTASFSYTFTEAGGQDYFCRPHLGLGMVGTVTVNAATGTTHTVNQVGLTFSPAVITIEVGDTVEWVWSVGIHTVTSGTDLDDPEVGVLFDAPLNELTTSFSYTFTEAGGQDYFCRPHLGLGMVGTVNVMAVTAVGDTPSSVAMQLQPNVPNPFNPSTKISFEMPADREGPVAVNLQVFDLKGRLVRTLVDRTLTADQHTVNWNGRDRRGQAVPAGVYFYRLDAGGQSLTRSMTLVK